jgi:hypothetical protein
MSKIHAIQLARTLQIRPSLAYRTPLSRLDGAITALSSASGPAYRTLCEARERKCGLAHTSGIPGRA